MPDMLQEGFAWLEAKRHAIRTIEVTYKRGADSVSLSATVGKTDFEEGTDYGIVERTQARDYLIRTQDLILGGSTVLPAAGDKIEEVQGATTYVYEVMAPGREPVYRFSDPHRLTLRIHTKLVQRA